MITKNKIKRCEIASLNMRKNIIHLAHQAGNNGSHLGPALSIVEIMAVLYLDILNIKPSNHTWESRDRFLLSKGHGGLGYYVAMYEAGVISKQELYTYEVNGGFFPGQPSKNLSLGIEYSGGSLGLGLSYGAGIAIAAKRKNESFRTFVLMGDGEINEGSVWESVMFAKHNKLSNLTAIIDKNSMQSDGPSKDIINIDIEAMWRGFGWEVITCDGHDIKQLMQALKQNNTDNPKVIIASTIKGKGISFMENSKEWHHNRLTDDLYQKAFKELEGMGCDSDGI
ncbi:MAG TPA: transketolase [Anaerovoracaceae bacterium]|nr:transketolase [Anaerovoracaceae bacterium]